jgi:uncharacterized protein (TIGR03086 family)
MDPYEALTQAVDEVDRRVGGVGDEQWALATPCSEWDVRDLVHHLVYECVWAPPLFEGKTVDEVGDAFEGELLGDDPVTAWKAAAEGMLDAVRIEGVMDRTVHLSFGDFEGRFYAAQLASDLTIHAWDLARAIGGDEMLPAGLVELAWDTTAPMADMGRQVGVFGPVIDAPEGADQQARLLAMVGRRV